MSVAPRLWVGRWKESILGYVPKNNEKKELMHLRVKLTKKYSEIHDNWIGYGATQNPQTNPISSSESPLLIIVYISVLLQYTESVHLALSLHL